MRIECLQRNLFWTEQPHVGAQRSTEWLGGARRDRTDDLMLAKHALSQLSYGPIDAPQADRPDAKKFAAAVGLSKRAEAHRPPPAQRAASATARRERFRESRAAHEP
jgi:hypothetical protein